MRVTLITTVKNEAQTIEPFLESLIGQTRQPDEIIVADGGSTDGTVEKVESLRHKFPSVKVISAPGNISHGRNAAIQAASGEIIAATDAGSRADKHWLEELLKPFADENVAVASGYFKIDPRSTFEAASGYLIFQNAEELDDSWLPSSRSIAFRKSAWEAVKGYPEELSFAGEDTLFDLKLKEAGFIFRFTPKAFVYWRPRPNLRSFMKQYFLYAKGDGQYWPHSVGYGKKFLLYAGLIALKVAAVVTGKFLLGAAVALLYLLYLIFRARKTWQRSHNLSYFLLSIPLVIAFDLSSLAGFLRGMADWFGNKKYRQAYER